MKIATTPGGKELLQRESYFLHHLCFQTVNEHMVKPLGLFEFSVQERSKGWRTGKTEGEVGNDWRRER